MKKIIKFQAEDSQRWFDTEEECLRFEAMQRILNAWENNTFIHVGIDEDDLIGIIELLKEHKEDLLMLLGESQ